MEGRFLWWICVCSWVTLSYCQERSVPTAKVLSNTFIFEKAPFAQCHASTLVELENGSIMAAWFGGAYERHPDVGIYASNNDSGHWSPPKMVADGTISDTLRYPSWNPVLFRNKSNQVLLYYKVGPSPSSWWGMYMATNDNGENWSAAQKFSSGVLGPIKNKPIQVGENLVVSPSSTESEDGQIWKSHIELSTDQGHTWIKTKIPSPDSIKVIQPTLLKLPNGDLKALMRSNQNVVMESTSQDNGITWSEISATTVANPNSGIDVVNLQEGGYLLVYNPTISGKDWSNGREKLNLAYSADGETWIDILKLENHDKGEFSYPAIIQDSKGFVHISYTHDRTKIKYVKLLLD